MNRPSGVLALFDAHSDAGELVREAAELARSRGVGLEVVAVVSPLIGWLLLVGRSTTQVSLPSTAAQSDDVVRSIARLIATVPRDVSVRWRIFHGRRRRALRALGCRAPQSGWWPARVFGHPTQEA
jgi:hypothetical protein